MTGTIEVLQSTKITNAVRALRHEAMMKALAPSAMTRENYQAQSKMYHKSAKKLRAKSYTSARHHEWRKAALWSARAFNTLAVRATK